MLKSELELLPEGGGSINFEEGEGFGDFANLAPPSPCSSGSQSQSISRDAKLPRMYKRSNEVTAVSRIGRASSVLRIKVREGPFLGCLCGMGGPFFWAPGPPLFVPYTTRILLARQAFKVAEGPMADW